MSFTPAGTLTDLPQYRRTPDYAMQEAYQELLCLILTTWFSSNGFYQAQLTAAQVTALLAQPTPPPTGTHWYNVTVDAMQYIDNAGVVKTVTAT